MLHSLDSDRLGKVTREVYVEALENGKPVGNELQGNDVQNALEDINSLGDLNLLGLRGLELLITTVADDNGLAATSNDCRRMISIELIRIQYWLNLPCW